MRQLKKITEVFKITGVGLAVARFSLNELEALGIEFGEGFQVEVRVPDEAVRRTQAVVPAQFIDPKPKPDVPSFVLFLPNVTAEQVPVGTEIFVRLN